MKLFRGLLDFVFISFICLCFYFYSVQVHAQTAITVQTTSETDITPGGTTGGTDHAAGWTVTNPNGDVMLLIENTAATGSAVITITAQDVSVTVPGYGPLTKANLSITVGVNAQKIVGPFPPRVWNDTSGNIAGPAITGAGNADIIIHPFRYDLSSL